MYIYTAVRRQNFPSSSRITHSDTDNNFLLETINMESAAKSGKNKPVPSHNIAKVRSLIHPPAYEHAFITQNLNRNKLFQFYEN